MQEVRSPIGAKALRPALFLLGIFISSFGVALSTKCDLGISPISCLPYVLSLRFPLSMGTFTILLHFTLVLLQILLLRKKYKPYNLLQLVMAIPYGKFMDLSLFLLSGVAPSHYLARFLLCLVSIAVVALGVFLTVRADIIVLAGEGLVCAITEVTGWEFGVVKAAVDSCLAALGAVCSLLFFHTVLGFREGTFLAAVGVGLIIQGYNRLLRTLRSAAGAQARPAGAEAAGTARPHLVVTITREFWPNSIRIAHRLSELMGLKLYDEELVDMVIADSGLDPQFVRDSEARLTKGFLHTLLANSFAYPYQPDRQNDEELLLRSEQRVIRRLAGQEDCIILGRNANLILGKAPHYYHIFLHANPRWRVEETMAEFHLSAEQAQLMISRTDAQRRRRCKNRTGRVWGYACDFNLCLDVARYGVEKSARLLADAIRDFVYCPELTSAAVPAEGEASEKW